MKNSNKISIRNLNIFFLNFDRDSRYISLLLELFDRSERFQIIENYSVSPTLPIFSRIVQFRPTSSFKDLRKINSLK